MNKVSDKTKKIISSLSREQKADLDRYILENLKKQIEEQRKKENCEDNNRPLFNKQNLSEEEKNEIIEEFKMTDFYDYLVENLSTEDLQEYMYGQKKWEDYLAEKNKKVFESVDTCV
ncbi:MAG: hypothetical protein ACI4V7_07775 [Succinivibrionaceae bacterium]